MKISRAKDSAWRKFKHETVVIHLADRRIFGLNTAGGRMWEALSQPTTLERLEKVGAGIGITQGGTEVTAAVRRFVKELAAEGLVTYEGSLESVRTSAEIENFEAPRIEWREDLLQFAGMCQLVPGQHPACNQNPGGS